MSGQASIRFCEECNNMLYPKPDKRSRKLMYACKRCDYQEEATDYCVYVNRITHNVNELTQIVSDITADPSLPKTQKKMCSECGGKEAVYFQSQGARQDADMKLYYLCCNRECNHRWTE